MALFRRIFVVMLVGTMMFTSFGFQPVQAKTEEETLRVEKNRASITKLGTGRDARVEVKLRDNTKLKGYVSDTAGDSFTVIDSKTGESRTVTYGDVEKLNKQGKGFSTLTKVLIGAAVATGVIVGWQIIKPALCDGGAQTRGPC
jgi:hypothetical protein